MEIDKKYIHQLANSLYFALNDEQSSKVMEIIIGFQEINSIKTDFISQITNNQTIILRDDVANHTNLDVLKNTTMINEFVVSK